MKAILMRILKLLLSEENSPEEPIKIPKAPHEIFPEIMHWKAGDELSEPSNDDQLRYAFYSYQAVDGNGNVYAKHFDGHKIVIDIEDIGDKPDEDMWFNVTLHNRKLSKEMEHADDYMQLIKDFQQAYKEISE